jgi:hypothetical protein
VRHLRVMPPRQRVHPELEFRWDLPAEEPAVSLEALPGLALPGDEVDLLAVLAAAFPIRDVTLGVVLPAGGEVVSVTPPRGCRAEVWIGNGRPVVTCDVPFLAAGHACGMEVTMLAPTDTGRLMVTAFATPAGGLGPSRTAACTVPVL